VALGVRFVTTEESVARPFYLCNYALDSIVRHLYGAVNHALESPQVILNEAVRGTATSSANGAYRYLLTRSFDDANRDRCLFIMLNPSTADASTDDPTIRRCSAFARSWGFGAMEVVNLFAYRATDPRELRHTPDPVGADNDRNIVVAANRAHLIVAAWGCHGEHLGRGADVASMVGREQLHTLGVTKSGEPKHPLYLRRDSTYRRYCL